MEIDGANSSKQNNIVGNERERLIEAEAKAETSCSTCVPPACRNRIVNGAAALFFMSLELFYCVNVDTKGDSDDANDDRPLIPAATSVRLP